MFSVLCFFKSNHRMLRSKTKYVPTFKIQHCIFMQCIETKVIHIHWNISLLQSNLMIFHPRKTFRKNLCHHQYAMISIFPEMKFRKTTTYRIKVRFSLLRNVRIEERFVLDAQSEHNTVAIYYKMLWGFFDEFIIAFIIFLWYDWNSIIDWLKIFICHVWLRYSSTHLTLWLLYVMYSILLFLSVGS